MAGAPRLKPLKDYDGISLKWSQPRGRNYYWLIGDGIDYATLKWNSIWGQLAVGVTSEFRLTFKRGGFVRKNVTIRNPELDSEVGKLSMAAWGGGTLELADGHRFSFESIRFWNPQWQFVSEDGKALCTFKPKYGFRSRQAEVIVEREGLREPRLGLLIVLGWYEIVTEAEEWAAASVAVAAGS